MLIEVAGVMLTIDFFFNEMANSEVSALYHTIWKANFHRIHSDKLIAKLDDHSKLLNAFQTLSSEPKENNVF